MFVAEHHLLLKGDFGTRKRLTARAYANGNRQEEDGEGKVKWAAIEMTLRKVRGELGVKTWRMRNRTRRSFLFVEEQQMPPKCRNRISW
jgi:hypothetical protein